MTETTSKHRLRFHKSLEAIIDAFGDAYMLMMDFPMVNALEHQFGCEFLTAFMQRAETVIREYINATNIKETLILDATWMGPRLAISVAGPITEANLNRVTDHLKTSIETMGNIEFKQDGSSRSIVWRTRPYLAHISDYRSVEPEIMLQELNFALFHLKLREMKAQNLSTKHLLPSMAQHIEECEQDQSEAIECAIEHEKEMEIRRKGRTLERALANHEVPIIFNPVREYATGLIAAMNADIGETDLIMKHASPPDGDGDQDPWFCTTETADSVRGIAAWYGLACELDIYILQEAMDWFSRWRVSPNIYYPVRLQVHLPLMLFKPENGSYEAIEQILNHYRHIASDLTIVLEPPGKFLDEMEVTELQASLTRLSDACGVRYALGNLRLYGQINHLEIFLAEALFDRLNVRLVKLSEEWSDLPPNNENLGLLELMIKELTDERIEIVAPNGLSGKTHKCMKSNGVYAYEEKGDDNELSPQQVGLVLQQELKMLNQSVGKNSVIFGRPGRDRNA